MNVTTVFVHSARKAEQARIDADRMVLGDESILPCRDQLTRKECISDRMCSWSGKQVKKCVANADAYVTLFREVARLVQFTKKQVRVRLLAKEFPNLVAKDQWYDVTQPFVPNGLTRASHLTNIRSLLETQEGDSVVGRILQWTRGLTHKAGEFASYYLAYRLADLDLGAYMSENELNSFFAHFDSLEPLSFWTSVVHADTTVEIVSQLVTQTDEVHPVV